MLHFRPGSDAAPIGPLAALPVGNARLPRLRPLTRDDETAFADHLLRLDDTARRMRFGTPVNDGFLERYAAVPSGRAATRIGVFFEAKLGGVCELHLDPADPTRAEAAFSLEAPYRGLGHGACMFRAVLSAARSQGVERLTLQCLRENAAMRAIARRFADELRFEGSELTATLCVPAASGPAGTAMAPATLAVTPPPASALPVAA